MKYYLKNNSKELIDLKENMIVGEAGNDGEVYKYGDKAIKLLHIFKEVPAMTEKKAKLFKNNLNLKSFIGIDDLLYDEHKKYSGYSMKYEKEDFDKTLQIKVVDFLDNLNDLSYDINQLSKINCNIIDLAQEGYELNCICNERIRPIDMDNYEIDKTMTYNELYSANNGALKNLLFQIFLILYEKKLFLMDDINNFMLNKILDIFYNELSSNLYNMNILEYFQKELNYYDTLDQYMDNKIIYTKKYIMEHKM